MKLRNIENIHSYWMCETCSLYNIWISVKMCSTVKLPRRAKRLSMMSQLVDCYCRIIGIVMPWWNYMKYICWYYSCQFISICNESIIVDTTYILNMLRIIRNSYVNGTKYDLFLADTFEY